MEEARQMDEIKTLLMAVSRIEQKVDNLGNVREIAIQTQESAKSAHNRIDDLKTEFTKDLHKAEKDLKQDYEKQVCDLKDEHSKRMDKLEDHNKWLGRLTVGGFITGFIAMFFYIIQNGGI